ncbi:MAG: polymer-forming cytoskeletal protein [Deltaproteobacteria bacterium]|nr:polymer-forming cytoskeletal protein [Deltaproteobacteria bacterium]
MQFRILVSFLIVLFLGGTSNAAELRFDQQRLNESIHIEDDYLFTGEQLHFNGKARDLFFFGKELEFTGNLNLALFAMARSVSVRGSIGNGIKAAAQFITVHNKVIGTNLIGAEEVVWETDQQSIGDTFIGARKVFLKGPIKGNIYIGAGEVFIENEIKGNVQIRAGQLKIAPNGRIDGNLKYYSDRELSPEETARITGTISYVTDEAGIFEGRAEDYDDDMPIWLMIILKLALTVVGLIILIIPATKGLEKQLDGRAILSLSVWGLIPVFVYPTLMILSVLLIITIPFAVFMILAFVPIFVISTTIGITMIGGFLVKQMKLNISNRFIFYLMAAVLYSFLSLAPFFGILLMFFVSSVGCGQARLLMMKKP